MNKTTSNQPPDGRLLGKTSPPLSTNRAATRMVCPTHWPSLEPGRSCQLNFEAATTGSTASILLQVTSAKDIEKARALLERLGSNPERWLETIQALLTTSTSPTDSSRALGAHLLIAPQAPGSPVLEQRRQALGRGNCSSPSQAARSKQTQP